MKISIRRIAAAAVFALPLAAAAQAEDPFRWLEESATPRAEAFYREQDAQSREVLARIAGREALRARIHALANERPRIVQAALGGLRVFTLELAPGAAGAHVVMREGGAGAGREVFDPAPAQAQAIAPSPDGRHVAIAYAAGGDTRLRVIAVDSGKPLPFEIAPLAPGEAVAWHPDGRSFYYTRDDGEAARIYRHVLGRAPDRDEIVFAPGVGGALNLPAHPRLALHVPLESRVADATVRAGEQRGIAVYSTELRDLAAGRPRWRRIASREDGVLAIEAWHDDLYVLSRKNAPRHRVLRVKAGATDLAGAKVAVAEGDSVIRSMALAREALYLRTMVAGVDRLERLPLGLLGGGNVQYIRTPFDAGITRLFASPRLEGAWLQVEGWLEPPALLRVDRRGDAQAAVQFPALPPAADVDEVRLYAPTTDNVKIPITLLYRRSTRLTRDNPTLLVAYGSFGETLSPTFDAARLAWIERGGVLAIAHVRGGGEYGEAWHEAGRGAAKSNTVADLAAVADFLERYGFTAPRRLAVMGSGAGGIAAAGAFVRRPDLFAALVARAPLTDLVRAAQAGAAEQEEFGPPEAAERASAYQQVRPAMPYPAALVLVQPSTAAIPAWQAGKLVARLQAATSSGRPVLLRLEPAAPVPRAAQEDEAADLYSFLLWQMGDPRFQGPPPASAGPVPAAREPVAQ